MTFKHIHSIVLGLFRVQAKQSPEAVAARFQNQDLTYLQLERASNAVAAKLTSSGFKPGSLAAITSNSPLEMLPGILGIIKAGGGYIPVRSGTPVQYVQNILRRGQVDYYVISDSHRESLDLQCRIIPFDITRDQEDTWKNGLEIYPEDPFAVFYQSHSSGKPEGITLSREKVAQWVRFNLEKLHVDFTRTLFISDFRTENSFPLWLGNLVSGGCVYFHRAEDGENGISRLLELAEENDFTSIVCSLPQLDQLIRHDKYRDFITPGTRNIITLGEGTDHLDIDPFKTFIKNNDTPVRWHNFYGFPGTAIITTLVEDEFTEREELIHIGRPISETRAYILDSSKQLVPIGKIGQLYLAGTGIPDRYHRNEKLTGECFVQQGGLPESHIFNTGYSASWRPDGKLSLLGRTDNLVHINGTPVAPEEVEAVLSRNKAVNDCAVVAKKNNGQILQLIAYIVPKEEIDETGLQDFLKQHLPRNYFPIGLIRLDVLPRTADGLVDRKFLEQLNRLDSLQLRSLEQKISQYPSVDRAAAFVSEEPERPLPLHIKDYTPVSPSLSLVKEKESAKITADRKPQEKRFATGSIDGSRPAIIHGKELVWQEDDPRILADALKRAATLYKDHGIRFIMSDGTEHVITYPELWQEASRVAAGLKKAGLKPQDKVMFQFNRNDHYVSAFWGCMLAGLVPVPMMVPKAYTDGTNETRTLKRVWELLEQPVILTNENLKPSIRSLFSQFRLETVEHLRDNPPIKNIYRSSPQDLAILLFTSGSTGIPKGVKQSHLSILSREKSTTIHNGGTPHDVSINWMPLEHVGGVVMFHINDVFMGCQQIQVSTQYILADPLRWLDIISTYRGTITWAPNFAYALVSEAVDRKKGGDWDLSSMRFILNGGEAVNAASAKGFLKRLAPYGLTGDAMKPAWGMSETCSGVAYSHSLTEAPHTGVQYLDKQALTSGRASKNTPGNDLGTSTFTELGHTIPGTSIRIADSSGRVVEENIIGHLQIKGPTVTSGYYKNPELNKEVFTADGWFDTGDLAFISDGRMTITGRAKDVIIVNGINLNSGEIEAAVEEVEGVETSFTAACAVREENGDTDRVAIFYHSAYSDFNRQLEQVKHIRKKFSEKFGLNLDFIVPLPKEEIPKTSIGKIQRLKLARSFQNGDFDHIVKQLDIGLENENTLPSWFFKKTWRNHSLTLYDPSPNRIPRTCLVFEDVEDSLELSDKLISRLQEENCRCIRVKSGGLFKIVDASCYQIDRGKADNFRSLIKSIDKQEIQIDDIFFLYGGKKTSRQDLEPVAREMDGFFNRGVYSLLNLIRALDERFHRVKRLFVVTANALFTPGDDQVAFENSGVSGFLKSVSLELDWLHCCHIDLDDWSGLAGNHSQALIREWKNPADVKEIAYRNGRRLLPVLSNVNMDKEEIRDIPVKQGGIYLVTGGLGGIGTHVCQWLMKTFAARLLIVGRTQLPERGRWESMADDSSITAKRIRSYLQLETLESRGDFMYVEGDVADPSFLQRVAADAQSLWNRSLDGVFHLAGYGNLEYHWTVMDKHRVVRETPRTFEDMFRSKVYGTLALHRLFQDDKNAIFVAFSSTIAFFGASTFSAYSAANSFLDGFCRNRQSNGWAHTYCLNWSSWDDVGMSENNPAPMVNAMSARGYHMIPSRQGIHSLQIALRLNPGQLFIGLDPVNPRIRALMAEYPTMNQVLNVYYTSRDKKEIKESGLRQSIQTHISMPGVKTRTFLNMTRIDDMPMTGEESVDYRQLRELEGRMREVNLSDEGPQTETEKKLLKIWREILNRTHIGVDDNFFELGGHSLNASVLLSRIYKELNTKLSISTIFEGPTVRELAAHIRDSAKDKYVSIQPAEQRTYYPVSSAQARMYIMQQLDKDLTNYNIPTALTVTGELDIQKLEDTFQALIDRHESLRTSFMIVPGKKNEPVQIIHPRVKFRIMFPGASDNPMSEFVRPFDLSRAPLLRVALIEQEKNRHLLMIDMHHIISDGVSMEVFVREFLALFAGEPLPPLKLQYKDFSLWQNRFFLSEAMKKQETFWLDTFKDEVPQLQMPTTFSRPSARDFKGDIVSFGLGLELTRQLNQLARDNDTTLFMVLLAGYHILLSQYSGQEDIVVGSPAAGRGHPDLENIVGMFVNTLALRNYPANHKTYNQFLQDVKTRTLDAFENQDYPLESIVEKLQIQREAGRNPLFDTMFALQNVAIPEIKIKDIEIKPYKFAFGTSHFDIVLSGEETGAGIHFDLEYCTQLFSRNMMDKMTEHFINILKEIVKNPGIQLSKIEMRSEDEKIKITAFNRSEEGGSFEFE